MIFTKEQLQYMHDTNGVFIQVLRDADEFDDKRYFAITQSVWKSGEGYERVFELETTVTQDYNVVMDQLLHPDVANDTQFGKSKWDVQLKEIEEKE